MLLKVTVERDDLNTPGFKQRQVCDIRQMVCVHEHFKPGLKFKTVLMEEPGSDRVVAGQPFDKPRIQCDLLFRLGNVHKPRTGKAGKFLRWTASLCSEFHRKHGRVCVLPVLSHDF